MMQPEEKTLYPIYTYEDYREKLSTVFENYRKKMAITCVGDNAIEREITYEELLDIANKINAFLQGLGLIRAQRVAVISPPTAEDVVLNMALAYGGYTNVLIDATLELPKESVIWCANHGFKDDVAASLGGVRHSYILFGSLPLFINTHDGVGAYINGL